MDTYHSFDELAAANCDFTVSSPQLSHLTINSSTWNMGRVGELKSGCGLYIHSDDHGNPHVDVMHGKHKLAKIFMQPEITLDHTVKCRLSKAEQEEAFALIKSNLVQYKEKWNEIHKYNRAAQPAIIEGENDAT